MSILEQMKAVEEGDEVLWNGRKVAQPVMRSPENQHYFEVEGNRGGRYRFFTTSSDGPHLINLNRSRRYSVDEFRTVS